MAIPVVVDERPLSRQLAALAEPAPDASTRKQKRFPDRHLPVLVEVRLLLAERLDEELRKHGFKLLRRSVGGGHDDMTAARKLFDEGEAAACRVHEDEAPRYRANELGPFTRAQVGTDQVELRFVPLSSAVPHEQHEQE